MSYTLCCKSLRMSRCIVSHGLEETADRFLVERRDASVLRDQLLFFWRKQLSKRRRAPARQHKRCIYPLLFERRHIAKIKRVCSQLIVFLSPPTHPKKYSKLCLI